MKQEFIDINNKIIDFDEYAKTTILLKNYLGNKIKEIMFEEGFFVTVNKNSNYHRKTLTFYNTEKDLEVKINIKKKNKEEFLN